MRREAARNSDVMLDVGAPVGAPSLLTYYAGPVLRALDYMSQGQWLVNSTQDIPTADVL